MNKKVLILLLLGVALLNGCGFQGSAEKKSIGNIATKVKTIEKENIKKQQTEPKKEDEQENKNVSVIDKKNLNEQKKEVAETATTSTSSSVEEPQVKTYDKSSSTSTQTKVEQPVPSAVEQVPQQSKQEPVQPIKQDSMASSVMSQINSYRIQNGLQPFNSSQYYQDKADAHALDMANKKALWHSDNGECITNYPDPFNAWINSPEHREIILTENNTIGVVSIYYADGYYYSVFSTAW